MLLFSIDSYVAEIIPPLGATNLYPLGQISTDFFITSQATLIHIFINCVKFGPKNPVLIDF